MGVLRSANNALDQYQSHGVVKTEDFCRLPTKRRGIKSSADKEKTPTHPKSSVRIVSKILCGSSTGSPLLAAIFLVIRGIVEGLIEVGESRVVPTLDFGGEEKNNLTRGGLVGWD